jgi:hypothetical protein
MIQQYAKAFPLPRFGIQHSRSSTFPKESSWWSYNRKKVLA